MNQDDMLSILKIDLGLATNTYDKYLLQLLNAAADFIKKEGINLDNSNAVILTQIQYAAYLFRRRGGTETTMPRYLRYELNCLLINQKGNTSGGESSDV